MSLIPKPVNEPIKSYAPGSPERAALKARLDSLSKQGAVEITSRIAGQSVQGKASKPMQVVMPHEHSHVLGTFTYCSETQIESAFAAARSVKADWENMEWKDRAAIFLKAADLLAGPYRDLLNGATMLGQSKNVFQAEIDSACELIDFLRFNAYFYEQIQEQQPVSAPGIWNRLEYRPLEGVVAAITPFNFTAIAANLPAVPAMLGNTVVWKPSDTQLFAAHYTMQLFEEAGLPPGVINLVLADGPTFGKVMLAQKDLAGIHFTGSTGTFKHLWKGVAENLDRYSTYPRLVGETGGKDFVFAHPSADVEALRVALVRGAFEYQGQKCSAASRTYIPASLWKQLKPKLIEEINALKRGDVRDFTNIINAVIDERSFKRISGYLDQARGASGVEILAGGKGDRSKGFFIEPTLIQAQDPMYRTLCEEIFGPVLSLYVYEDSKLDETLKICDQTSPYALTGAVFAQDRQAIVQMSAALKNAAGNFYINDKPTGAVVGQQPFGGARASGTNDKAGSLLNLLRFVSARTVKETFVPPTGVGYPFMGEK